ncbi:DUF362 domain-containing protein [bacterium]|nr:DUF362 domain-containing protein [bacterium]
MAKKLNGKIGRREFIKTAAGTAAGLSLFPLSSFSKYSDKPSIIVVKNGSPAELVRNAVESLGGMSKFVSKGDIVVLKPNMSWDRVPEQAATTNPEVVAEVVKMCFDAGAKKVKIFDNTLNEVRRCYKRSGIQKAAEELGADVMYVRPGKFKKTSIPDGKLVKSWALYEDALDADVLINIPIAKHHSLSGVSLGMKNYMGYLGGNRGKFHRDFNVKITDLNTKFKADLTILDAYRMLLRNGPSGGNVKDVALKKIVVAGTDPVAVDSYGVKMFGLDPLKTGFLKEAEERGLGQNNLSRITVKTISL